MKILMFHLRRSRNKRILCSCRGCRGSGNYRGEKDTIDINPEIFQAILYEAPMSITRLPRDQYPKGDGWQLLSDQDREEPKIDPRWEKLNDFKLDDD